MKNIATKLIMYLCACIMASSFISIQSLAVLMLICIAVASLAEYNNNIKSSIMVFILVTICAYFYTAIIFFIPLFMYDLFRTRYHYLSLTGIVALALQIQNINLKDICLLLIISASAYFIKYQIEKDNASFERLLNQRDEQNDKRIILEERFKALSDSQDAQINIATLNERNRIAHEIHDNVGHLLSSSIIQIGAAMAITKEEHTKQSLSVIKDTLNKGMDSIRSSIHNIHDNSIDLDNELKQITDNFSFCKMRYRYDVVTPLPLKVRYDIIAISKEALSNVIKHSDAKHVTLNVFEHPEFYQLIIYDNGTKKEITDNTGMGLDGIKQRVSTFNGIINISDDKGFRIFISIPKKAGEKNENSNS